MQSPSVLRRVDCVVMGFSLRSSIGSHATAVALGAVAAAVALSLSMAYRTGRTCLRSPIAWGLFAVALVATAVIRLPLPIVLAVLAPPAMWWAWPHRRQAAP